MTRDWIALDDVSVNAVATPEPASVIALGIGIVGIVGMGGYALRRRRTAALATCLSDGRVAPSSAVLASGSSGFD